MSFRISANGQQAREHANRPSNELRLPLLYQFILCLRPVPTAANLKYLFLYKLAVDLNLTVDEEEHASSQMLETFEFFLLFVIIFLGGGWWGGGWAPLAVNLWKVTLGNGLAT